MIHLKYFFSLCNCHYFIIYYFVGYPLFMLPKGWNKRIWKKKYEVIKYNSKVNKIENRYTEKESEEKTKSIALCYVIIKRII